MNGFHAFTVLGIPVHLSIWFLLIVGWWSFGSGPAIVGVTWAVTITVSVLVHELGHGLVARHYRLQPSILLHGLGGLTSHARAEHDRHDALIVAAGPAAGLLLGGLVWGLDHAARAFEVGAVLDLPWYGLAVDDLLYINIGWSFVNLLPLWPLDGGLLFRLAAVRRLRPVRGERITHLVGIATGLVAGYIGYTRMGSTFIAVGGGYLAWLNYEALGSQRATGPIRPRHDFAKGLLEQAETSLAAGDWAEAGRLGHQIRWLDNLSDDIILRVWGVLAMATGYGGGDAEEALRYARRAPEGVLARLATVRALCALGRRDEAREALARVGRVPAPHRDALDGLRAALAE